MHEMYELKEMLCDELEKITKKGELSAGSLDAIDKLTHSIKSIETIMAMDGYSGDGSYMGDDYSYARGGQRGGSYAQRRDSRGRYSRDGSYSRGDRRGGYSRDEEMDMLKEDLHEMLMDAQSEEQKQMIRKWMKQIER